jgi:hypothetical protein
VFNPLYLIPSNPLYTYWANPALICRHTAGEGVSARIGEEDQGQSGGDSEVAAGPVSGDR